MDDQHQSLPIADIHFAFQGPECLDVETVESYAQILRAGGRVAPVQVRFDGERYWLQNGFHRIEAARRLDIETIDAEGIPGTLADMEAEWKQMMDEARESLRGER